MLVHHHRLPKHVDKKPVPLEYQASEAPDLVAAWPGPSASGGIDDIVGGLDVAALPGGVTATESPYGPALDFSGRGTVNLGSLAAPGDFTVMALVKHGTIPGMVLHAGNQTGVGLSVTPNGAFGLGKVGGQTEGNLIPLGAGPDEWYVVALTVEGTTGGSTGSPTGTVYVNGQAVWRGTAPAGASGNWQFGDGQFNGQIADARIYNKALTQKELRDAQEGPEQWKPYRLPPPDAPVRKVWRRAEGFGRKANTDLIRVAARHRRW